MKKTHLFQILLVAPLALFAMNCGGGGSDEIIASSFSACTADTDCSVEGELCNTVSGVCAQGCGQNEDCVEGEICNLEALADQELGVCEAVIVDLCADVDCGGTQACDINTGSCVDLEPAPDTSGDGDGTVAPPADDVTPPPTYGANSWTSGMAGWKTVDIFPNIATEAGAQQFEDAVGLYLENNLEILGELPVKSATVSFTVTEPSNNFLGIYICREGERGGTDNPCVSSKAIPIKTNEQTASLEFDLTSESLKVKDLDRVRFLLFSVNFPLTTNSDGAKLSEISVDLVVDASNAFKINTGSDSLLDLTNVSVNVPVQHRSTLEYMKFKSYDLVTTP